MTISEQIKNLGIVKRILKHKTTFLICITILILCVAVVWLILSASDSSPGDAGSGQPNSELTTSEDISSSATSRTEISGHTTSESNFATTAGSTAESVGSLTGVTSAASVTGSGSVSSTTVASFKESTTTSFSATTSTSKTTATVATNTLENAGQDANDSFGKLQ